MTSSLSNLVNNLSEAIYKIKCKHKHENKKCETRGIKHKYCSCFSEYSNFKNDLIEYKCFCYNKNYQQKFDESLKEQFCNTYKSYKNDKNKFILLLQKGVYPYEYMDDWKKYNKTSLPEKEDFYSHLNMEDITNADYVHWKTVWKIWNEKFRGISWFVCSKQ